VSIVPAGVAVLPALPALPVAPALPVDPALPVGPALPVDPALPVGPAPPVAPALPVDVDLRSQFVAGVGPGRSGRRVLGGSKTLARSPLRLPAAAAAVVAAAAHLPVIPDHLSETPYVGWLFVGLSAACVLGAVALVLDDATLVWTTLGAACAAAVVGFALSRGPGLPAMTDDIGDWTNPLGLISVVAETMVAGLAVAALRPGRPRAGSGSSGSTWAGRAWYAVPVTAVLIAAGLYPVGLLTR
jgi:hypothetical protein